MLRPVEVNHEGVANLKRVLMFLVAAVSSLLLGVAPAAAAPYPPAAPTVVTDSGTYVAGSPVVITARGFGACVGGIVTFTITPPGGGTPIVVTAPLNLSSAAGLRTAALPAADAFDSATVTITAGKVVGVYTVTATCGSLTATTTFGVRKLPPTGSNIDVPLQSAAVLVLLGAGLVVVALRRRRPATAVA